jgi:glycosyltransferase involved in cell wall biosynthesis
MKIVFLTRNYPPIICGVGDYTYFLAQELAKKGITISILCFSDQTPVQSDNISVYPIIKSWNTEGVSTVIDFVKKWNPHWFITQYVPYSYNVKGLPFAFLTLYRQLNRLRVPVLTVFHEVKIRPEKKFKTQILSFLQGQIAASMAHKSAKIVTSIDFYADNLKQFKDKINLIPVASNIPVIEVENDLKNQLKEKNNIPQNAKIIGTFGNRNLTNYLVDFDALALKYPHLIWLICGKNSTPSVFFDNRSYIRNLGKMPAENIYQHLSLGDIFFMPEDINAKNEGGTSNKSGSLACAFSLGIPIIGIKGDMNNRLLEHKINILLADTTQKNALFDAIDSCLISTKNQSKLSENAYNLYENALKWPIVAEKILSILTH